MHIEGRAMLDYPAYRSLMWASGKKRFLWMWGVALVAAAGLLHTSTVNVLVVVYVILVPLLVDLSLRQVWRRHSGGGPTMEIWYELTDDGLRVSCGGVLTQYQWQVLLPLPETARHWRVRNSMSRRAFAIPRDAFSVDVRAEVGAVLAGLRRDATPA